MGISGMDPVYAMKMDYLLGIPVFINYINMFKI
jgi:hypothetical protein